MVRTVLITAAASAWLAFAGAAAPAARPVDQVADLGLPVSVRVAECVSGTVPESRLAVFRGSMKLVLGADQMWMRFTLEERVGRGRFAPVRAPDLDVWHKSSPGVTRFSYRQRVLALADGATYKALVSFRWYAAAGRLVRRARRRSSACRQQALLPDPRVSRPVGRRGRPVRAPAR